jgi:ABC-2 type transport system ATP-binding protein
MGKDVTRLTTASEQMSKSDVLAIEVKDLCKSFKDFRAVDHLTLSVKLGEIFGLLGPNGSGKTTTINMISGLSVPTSGEVRVMGVDL